jgi:microcystin-dependent protein
MADAYIGNVILVAFNFAPSGYLFCNGQLLPIAQNTALFSLLGTQYGGNGTTNFALPDLRGRVPVGFGTGAGLTSFAIGETGGSAAVSLLSSNLPAHTHALNVQSGLGTTGVPTGVALAQTEVDDGTPVRSYSSAAPNTTLAGTSISSGSGLPLPILNPYLGLGYAICTSGVFPPRS